jgi:hypothetical protein
MDRRVGGSKYQSGCEGQKTENRLTVEIRILAIRLGASYFTHRAISDV